MTADVVEGTDLLVVVAHDHDRMAADVHGDVVARFGNVRLRRDMDPVAGEDRLHVEVEDLLAE